MKTGIYVIEHVASGDCYVGSSKDIDKRFYSHRYNLRRGCHHSPMLQYAWDTYGQDAFTFNVLEECALDRLVLLAREQHYLDSMKPGYNVCLKAGSRLGSKQSTDTIAKMSAALTGKKKPPRTAEHIANLTAATAVKSPETREKMAAAKRGRTIPDETRAKMSAAHTGRSKSPEATAKTQAAKAERKFAERQAALAEMKDVILVPNDVRLTLRKLTVEAAIEIRNSSAPARVLALEYNISQTTVNKIRRGLIYRDV